MKKLSTQLLLGLFMAFAFVFASRDAKAQITPDTGSVVFTLMNTDDPDRFEFLTLKRINLTQLNFTDNGLCATVNRFRTGENTIAGSTLFSGLTDVPAGTFVRVDPGTGTDDNDPSDGVMTFFSSSFSGLSASGDQIIAHTGTVAGSSDCTSGTFTGTYVAGINGAIANWNSGASSSNNSLAPGTPSDFATGSTNDNARLNSGTSIVGTFTGIRTAITNSSNWVTDNSTAYTFSLNDVKFHQSDYSSGSISFSSVTNTGFTIDASGLTFGGTNNNTRYIVVIRATSAPDAPVDRYTCYTSVSGDFTAAPDVVTAVGTPPCTSPTSGNGKVVYFGYTLPSALAITNLTLGTTYQVSVYAVNGNGHTSNMSGTAGTGSQATTGGGSPTLATSGTINNFGAIINGANSTEQSFTISGDNLTNDVTITAPTHFQVSLSSGAGFGSSVSPARTSGGAGTDLQGEPVTIYVRMSPSAAAGAVSGNITNVSMGATTQNVAVAGNAVDAEASTQSTITFGTVTSTSIDVNFSGGNGAKRILVAKSGSAVNSNPVDGTTYTANLAFGTGTQIGTGNYVIAAGAVTTATVTGLTAGTTYHFAVYEYNDNSGTTGAENYFTTSPGTNNQATSTATYTWNVASGSWGTAGNWTPARTTPGSTDVLIFDGATQATPTVTMNVSETVGQISFTNNVNATLTSNASGRLITIDGGIGGTDFSIATGSQVTFENTSSGDELEVNITTGETGSIAGTLTMQGAAANAAHRLRSVDASGIAVTGTIIAGTNFTGNMFGDGTGTSALNSVHFNSGSVYRQQAGSNPFGAANPDAVAVFNTGSSFKFEGTGAATPSFGGRTYNNFEFDCSCTSVNNLSFTSVPTINGNFVVTNAGSDVIFTGAGGVNFNGDITIAASEVFNLNPSAGAPITFGKTGTQTISGAGTFTVAANANISVGASSTLALGKDVSIPSTLTIASGGKVNIGAGTTLTLSGTIAGAGTLGGTSTSNLIINGSGAFGTFNIDQTTPGTTNVLNNLTFNRTGGGTLTLGNALTVNGVVTHTAGTLSTGGFLSLGATAADAYGQIAGTGSGSISGNVTGNFVLPATTTGKWRGFSSPFTGNVIGDLADDITLNFGTPSFLWSNVYSLNEADCGDGAGNGRGIWQAVSSASQSMDNQGFSILLFSGDLPTNTTVDLTGTYTNGDYTTPALSFTNTTVAADSNGWHLLRNPWPSNYNHNTTITNLDANTIYLYEGSTVRDWNGAAGSITNGIVPPYHAMLVKVTATNSLTFPNTNRTTSNSNSFHDKTSLPNYVALKVTNPAGVWDETRIYSDNNAENGKDPMDAVKVLNNADAPTIYTLVDNNKTSINLINNVPTKGMSIPVAFTSTTIGKHTMSFTTDNVEPSVTLYLEDLKDKKLHKLENGNYTFEHTASTLANRFVLHYNLPSSTSVNETAETAMFISSNGNSVNVSIADAGVYNIEVIDLLGRTVTAPVTFNNAGNSMETISVNNVSAGYYLVKVTGNNGVTTTKVFLN